MKAWVTLYAAKYGPILEDMLPNGEVAGVAGTPLDFRQPCRIGARIDEPHEQLRFGLGYDHNWVVDGAAGTLRPAARVCEASSGRVMEVETTEPGIQFYSGNLMPEGMHGKAGKVYGKRHGLCLEAQHFYDSPNIPAFPSTVLRPGEAYHELTVHRFSTTNQRLESQEGKP